MDHKFEINRLEKEELTYELTIRGASNGGGTTVEDMRKMLRAYIRLERSGTEVTYPKYPFTFEQDIEYITNKCEEIKALISDFADFDTSPQFLKILSKLVHTFGRAQRMTSEEDEDLARKSQMLVELLGLESQLKSRARKFKRASHLGNSPLELSVLLASTNISSESESEPEDNSGRESVSTPAQNLNLTSARSENYKRSTPVVKWNITKFDGVSSRISLSAFLENVEELRLSRNVSYDELFAAASDLFTGQALLWYRSIRSRVRNWSQLVLELRLQFLPEDYNDRLFEEIKQRTQGVDESMGIYIAVMSNMFNRLTVTVSEAARLKILLKNISPFYQSQLGLVKVGSVSELLELGRKLEARKASIEAFVPPPRNRGNLMEPDLAYVCAESLGSNSSSSRCVDEVVCWNCKASGHIASKCAVQRKKRYCFRCGQPDVTVRTCDRCNRNSENSNGSH